MADPTAVQKRALAKLGMAMPDGSYYIRAGSVGASDLQNAIIAVGRGEPQSSHDAIRKHIMRRAKALGLSDKIPANWMADGSLKHDDLDQQADNFLKHFGIEGMRWGHHLPGTEAVGGQRNGDQRPGPFIQRGDHSGDRHGDSGRHDHHHDGKPPEQQAEDAVNAVKALHDQVAKDTEAAKTEAEAVPAGPAKETANAVVAASEQHKAAVAQLANKATAAHAANKAAVAKLAKKPATVANKKATASAHNMHASHMKHLAKTAHQKHAAHKAHVAKLKVKTKLSELNAHDKAALAKLSPSQRSALKKLTPAQRSTLNKMTPAQRAKLSHLTQTEKTALSHLSPAQKSALHKAQLASAKKRHDAAVARKQVAAGAKTAPNAQSATHADLGEDGDILEHHGVKGMKWGVRKAVRSAYGFPTGAPKIKKAQGAVRDAHVKALGHAIDHPLKTVIAVKGTQIAYANRHQIADFGVKSVGTAKIVAHIVKVMNEQRNSPQGEAALNLGRAYVQGHVIHVDDSGAIEHHGIKGMKWGIRRNGGHPGAVGAGASVHPISADAQKAHNVAETIHKHGTAALSNEDIQHLVNRQRLLQQHAQLNPADPSNVRKGLDFVKTVTGDAKTVLDAVETGRKAVKTFNGLASERPPHRQSRRTRNKPLKVVNIRAA